MGSLRSAIAGLVLILLCAVTFMFSPYLLWQHATWRKHDNTNLIAIARTLDAYGLGNSTTIGVYWAGILPYYMPMTNFHDFLGKSDRFIAETPAKWGQPGHNKWDHDYTLRIIRPDVIVTPKYADVMDDEAVFRAIEQRGDHGFIATLWVDPTFQQVYRPNPVRIATGSGAELQQSVYLRADPTHAAR